MERIICAANKYTYLNSNNESKELIILGIRHYDEIMVRTLESISVAIRESFTDEIQGFVDNRGKFLTREDAWVVAMQAGQIIRYVGGDNGKLFSENLY